MTLKTVTVNKDCYKKGSWNRDGENIIQTIAITEWFKESDFFAELSVGHNGLNINICSNKIDRQIFSVCLSGLLNHQMIMMGGYLNDMKEYDDAVEAAQWGQKILIAMRKKCDQLEAAIKSSVKYQKNYIATYENNSN